MQHKGHPHSDLQGKVTKLELRLLGDSSCRKLLAEVHIWFACCTGKCNCEQVSPVLVSCAQNLHKLFKFERTSLTFA